MIVSCIILEKEMSRSLELEEMKVVVDELASRGLLSAVLLIKEMCCTFNRFDDG